MKMTAQRPIRSAGWAFSLCNSRNDGVLLGFVILVCLFLSAALLWAQHDEHDRTSGEEVVSAGHNFHGTTGQRAGWEGSIAGIAYSEFNHHLTGMLVLIIGFSELRQALNMPFWAWTRFLLPGALLTAGSFLLIWSDHDAWPVGSLSFMQTFFAGDSEIFQHKSYALLSLTVGTIELLRRLGQTGHAVWAMPLPAFAIIGGFMLFGHSHGIHPSAHKIAMDHALMGTMAVTAGSSKLLSDWFRSPSHSMQSKWALLWAGLLLLIGMQLLIYSE
jgi:hypothetical protein